jgi:hypothetical protein
MKSKYILIGILSIVLLGTLVYFYAGSQAPSGQSPIQKLTAQNVVDIKSAFNATKDDVRVLVLLSPT